MKIFPEIYRQFRLIDTKERSINRLNRRTEYSKRLYSQYTDKSFRGEVSSTHFKLISSSIGRGAFCVSTGKLKEREGSVKVKIHPFFKYALYFFYALPIVGFFVEFILVSENNWPILILVAIGQMLFIRYLFIGLAFRILARESLHRLRDVLDIEFTV
ncbi:hypothetical protein ACFSQ0_04135 [Mesonia sediminis]|uniref:Glycosyl-4,4'-diaponeurosporenoate acyltransferase n=1 Tax=Mesonia sediminis TaxID=1703946 RepID=A0ABW5SDC7_9FLAO